MKDLASYIRAFREVSPFVGSLSRVQGGIRSALRLFSREYQLEDDATDSVSRAVRTSMMTAVMTVATLTEELRTLVDYNAFLAGGEAVPAHVFNAILQHRLLDKDLLLAYPEMLRGKYCGRMIWRVADSLMKESLQDLCAAAMAGKEEGGVA